MFFSSMEGMSSTTHSKLRVDRSCYIWHDRWDKWGNMFFPCHRSVFSWWLCSFMGVAVHLTVLTSTTEKGRARRSAQRETTNLASSNCPKNQKTISTLISFKHFFIKIHTCVGTMSLHTIKLIHKAPVSPSNHSSSTKIMKILTSNNVLGFSKKIMQSVGFGIWLLLLNFMFWDLCCYISWGSCALIAE